MWKHARKPKENNITMNFDECLQDTIHSSVGDVLDRMKTLKAEDRSSLILEWMEFLCFDDEEILMVPDFGKEVEK